MDRWVRVKDDDDNNGSASAFILLLAIAFILSPGVFLTALINSMFPISSIGTLWGVSVIASIVVFVVCCILTKRHHLSAYSLIAIVTTISIIVMSCFDNNNIFLSLVKRMIDYKS